MRLKNLSLYNFRNIAQANVEFKSHVNIFKGLNGQGKTNFVESIYLLSKGKSFRTFDIGHLIKSGSAEGTRAFGQFLSDNTSNEIELKILNHSKTHSLNSKKTNSLKTFKAFPVILFSPESLSAVKEGPEVRRNLIDETLVLEDEAHIKTLQNFRKILKSKNLVLKQFKQGKINSSQARDILSGLNPVFLEHSVELMNLRTKIIKNIHLTFQQSLAEITGKNVDIRVNYVPNFSEGKSVDFANTLRNKIEQNIAIEMASGLSLYGPHKDDIVFEYNGSDSRFYCSQGQQRALILAFKFSQILYHKAIYGYYPILILDDVLSEFDREKRSFLIQFLNKNEAQTFLTTTDVDDSLEPSNLDMSVLNVDQGRLLEL